MLLKLTREIEGILSEVFPSEVLADEVVDEAELAAVQIDSTALLKLGITSPGELTPALARGLVSDIQQRRKPPAAKVSPIAVELAPGIRAELYQESDGLRGKITFAPPVGLVGQLEVSWVPAAAPVDYTQSGLLRMSVQGSGGRSVLNDTSELSLARWFEDERSDFLRIFAALERLTLIAAANDSPSGKELAQFVTTLERDLPRDAVATQQGMEAIASDLGGIDTRLVIPTTQPLLVVVSKGGLVLPLTDAEALGLSAALTARGVGTDGPMARLALVSQLLTLPAPSGPEAVSLGRGKEALHALRLPLEDGLYQVTELAGTDSARAWSTAAGDSQSITLHERDDDGYGVARPIAIAMSGKVDFSRATTEHPLNFFHQAAASGQAAARFDGEGQGGKKRLTDIFVVPPGAPRIVLPSLVVQELASYPQATLLVTMYNDSGRFRAEAHAVDASGVHSLDVGLEEAVAVVSSVLPEVAKAWEVPARFAPLAQAVWLDREVIGGKLPPKLPADRIVWESARLSESAIQSAINKVQAQYGVRPRRFFGTINQVHELPLARAVYSAARMQGLAPDWLFVVAMAEGLVLELGWPGVDDTTLLPAPYPATLSGFSALGLDQFSADLPRLVAGGLVKRPFQLGNHYDSDPQINELGGSANSATFLSSRDGRSAIENGIYALAATLAERRRIVRRAAAKIIPTRVKKLSEAEWLYLEYLHFNAPPVFVGHLRKMAASPKRRVIRPPTKSVDSSIMNAYDNALLRVASWQLARNLGVLNPPAPGKSKAVAIGH